METNKLVETLTYLEIKVLPVVSSHPLLKEIAEKTSLKEVEVMRALQWLKNKGLVNITSVEKELVELDVNGKDYVGRGLPEVRFVKALKKPTNIKKIISLAKLDEGELNVCLGILRSKSAIIIQSGIVSITPKGKQILKQGLVEEKLLHKLSKGAVAVSDLSKNEKSSYEILRKRKSIIKVVSRKQKKAELTAAGKKIAGMNLSAEKMVDRLTSKIIISNGWKGKTFRRYDVKAEVPQLNAGRKQQYRKFLDHVREKFIALGFTEMSGPIVESDFWDMDALYMPQFHSARDIHDAYYIKEPKYCELDMKIVNKVKAAHENGFNTGSKGWGYKFDIKKTCQQLLRTHDTSISARTLASKDLKIPGKYFQIERCFRPDVIDASHNVDFHQIGGFVIGKGLNLKHLFGLLKMFAKEFANAKEFKIVPGYFPFTEPSAELMAKHPDLGWIELAGSGIFRPELIKPLVGKEVSAIAWGVGIGRIAMFNLGIKDIRDLFSHDLEVLRGSKRS